MKSAYKLAAQNRDNEAGREAGTLVEGGSVAASFPWHKIWQLKVPNKVQIFIWRFIHNSLPLHRTLKRRRIKTETLCPMCNKLDEDCGHLFLECKELGSVGERCTWRSCAAP